MPVLHGASRAQDELLPSRVKEQTFKMQTLFDSQLRHGSLLIKTATNEPVIVLGWVKRGDFKRVYVLHRAAVIVVERHQLSAVYFSHPQQSVCKQVGSMVD